MGSPANTLVPTEAHPANLYAAKQPWCECRVTLDPGFLLTRALDIAPGAPAGVHFPQVEYIRGAGRGNHWGEAQRGQRLASLEFQHAGARFLVLFRTNHPGADYIAIGHVLREYPVRGYWRAAPDDIICDPAGTVVITCDLGLDSWEGAPARGARAAIGSGAPARTAIEQPRHTAQPPSEARCPAPGGAADARAVPTEAHPAEIGSPPGAAEKAVRLDAAFFAKLAPCVKFGPPHWAQFPKWCRVAPGATMSVPNGVYRAVAEGRVAHVDFLHGGAQYGVLFVHSHPCAVELARHVLAARLAPTARWLVPDQNTSFALAAPNAVLLYVGLADLEEY